MEVDRSLIDKDFNSYVLDTNDITHHATALAVATLPPLDANQKIRKAQWESRVYYNALTADPYLSKSFAANVAYYVNAEYQLMQVIDCKTEGVKIEKICNLSRPATREENVSVQVAGNGLIVYCDGHGTLHVLKAENEQVGAKWSILNACAPCGRVPLLALGASCDDQSNGLYLVVAEALFENQSGGGFRLSTVALLPAATAERSTERAEAFVELEHTVTEIAIVSRLPTFVSFIGHDVVLLVQDTYKLLVPTKGMQTLRTETTPATGKSSPPQKCQQNENDALETDEMAMLLSQFPRAGIGYHSEVPRPKDFCDLASLDYKTPLSERFQKASTPFSSVNVHSTSDISTRSCQESVTSQLDRPLEVPTAESILSGFEECDNGVPNATACLVFINLRENIIQAQLGIDCTNFQFLCPSARKTSSSATTSTLLFQNDVHGLVFELNAATDRLSLRHVATLPAFGYVQASKQDKKFMTFHPAGAFACIGEFHRRVFVYQGHSSAKECMSHTRQQHVVEFGDQPILGLQIVNDDTILVLSSKHMYSLRLRDMID